MVQTQVQYIFVFRVIEEVLDKMLCDELTNHARSNLVLLLIFWSVLFLKFYCRAEGD